MDLQKLIIQFLKAENYPEIHTLTEEEILEVISPQNRLVLIRWLFIQINEEYSSFVETMSLEELADLLSYSGFCTKIQGINFLHGTNTDLQNKILCAMCKRAEDLIQARKYHTTPDYNLVEVFSTNTNLFTNEVLALNSKQRETKIKQYQKEIEALKARIEEKSIIETPILNNSNINNLMHDLKSNVNQFLEKSTQITYYNEDEAEEEDFSQSEQITLLEQGSKEVSKALNFIKNTSTICNFQRNNLGLELNNVSNENTKQIIEKISKLYIDSCKQI